MSASAFPDKQQELLDIFGEGDKVVARVRMTGTKDGGLPWFGIPANGRAIDVQWLTLYTLADGKVVETTSQMERAAMMQQLTAEEG